MRQIFTPISLLKKVFRSGERSLSREEISDRLRRLSGSSMEDAEKIIQAALNDEKSPFCEGSSRAIVEFRQQPASFVHETIQWLRKLGTPVEEEQLLRKLRSKNKISWSFSFERLGFLNDHRFVQLTDGRWLLTEWDIANDEVFRYLTERGITELARREIPSLLKVKLGMRDNRLFLPELDERFRIDDTKVYILDGQAEREQIIKNSSYVEVAATMSQETALKEKLIVDEVLEDLTIALAKLEQRSNEMKEEVIQHFSSNNLEAIKALMHEKERNEIALRKLRQLLDELA